jgi:hypothetical protein
MQVNVAATGYDHWIEYYLEITINKWLDEMEYSMARMDEIKRGISK